MHHAFIPVQVNVQALDHALDPVPKITNTLHTLTKIPAYSSAVSDSLALMTNAVSQCCDRLHLDLALNRTTDPSPTSPWARKLRKTIRSVAKCLSFMDTEPARPPYPTDCDWLWEIFIRFAPPFDNSLPLPPMVDHLHGLFTSSCLTPLSILLTELKSWHLTHSTLAITPTTNRTRSSPQSDYDSSSSTSVNSSSQRHTTLSNNPLNYNDQYSVTSQPRSSHSHNQHHPSQFRSNIADPYLSATSTIRTRSSLGSLRSSASSQSSKLLQQNYQLMQAFHVAREEDSKQLRLDHRALALTLQASQSDLLAANSKITAAAIARAEALEAKALLTETVNTRPTHSTTTTPTPPTPFDFPTNDRRFEALSQELEALRLSHAQDLQESKAKILSLTNQLNQPTPQPTTQTFRPPTSTISYYPNSPKSPIHHRH